MPINPIIIAVLYIVIGLLASLVAQFILYNISKRITNKLHKPVGSLIIKALSHYPFIWINGYAIFNAYMVLNLPISEELLEKLPNIVILLAIVTVAFVIMRFITAYLSSRPKYLNGKLQTTGVFINLIKIITFMIVGILILNMLGISIAPLIAALGVGGALAALTLQETFANFLSGFYIASSSQVKNGEYVKILDDTSTIEGVVTDILWRYTVVKDLYGNYSTIPNSKLAKATIVNYSQPSNDYVCPFSIKFSSRNDIEKVEKMITYVATLIARSYKYSIQEVEPTIRYSKIGDNYIEYLIMIKIQGYQNQYKLRSDLYKAILLEAKRQDISLPFEIQDVHINDGKNKEKINLN